MNNLVHPVALRTYMIRGADGNDLSISETFEGDQVVVSIQQNDDRARVATVRLDKDQLDAFWDVKYSLTLDKTKKEEE